MVNFPEILFAQSEKRSAIELRVASYIVVRVRMKWLTVLVAPFFLGLILSLDVHRAGIPIGLFPTNVIAALENQNALSRRGQSVSESTSSCSSSDDDHVVVFIGGHVSCLSLNEFNSLEAPCSGSERCNAPRCCD